MLRNVAKLGTASARSTGVAQASAHCRSQQPRVPATSTGQVGDGWLVTDLRQALDEDQVIFGTEEINSTLDSVMAYSTGVRHEAGPTVEVDAGEVEEFDTSLVHRRAADMQLMPRGMEGDFNRMLQTLLHNPEVQHACVNALRSDPGFLQLLDSADSSPMDIPMECLLPVSAGALALEGGGVSAGVSPHNNFVDMITNLANGLHHMGVVIRQKAEGARDFIGKMLIDLGCNLHSFMGQPFARTPLEEAAIEGSSEHQEGQMKAEVVGGVAIKVALAILTMVLLKRVYPIRFV